MFQFTSAPCRRKGFSVFSNQGKIVFAWVSGWISLLYQSNLFALVQIVPSWHVIIHILYMHKAYLVVYTKTRLHTHTHTQTQPLPFSPSDLAVSLIYEVPLIWPKRSLRDLPPLSSLHLCIPPSLPPSHQSPGRVNQRGGIAQQAIHRLDTLTNIPLSFSLPLFPSLSNFSIPPFLHVSWPLSKSNLALLLFSFPPSALLLDLLPPLFLSTLLLPPLCTFSSLVSFSLPHTSFVHHSSSTLFLRSLTLLLLFPHSPARVRCKFRTEGMRECYVCLCVPTCVCVWAWEKLHESFSDSP